MDDEIIKIETKDDGNVVDASAAKPKIKPMTPEREAEIARQMESIRGVTGKRSGASIFLSILAVVFVLGVIFFVMRTIWDSKMSVARHNFLYVLKRYYGLKSMSSGHQRIGVHDNVQLLQQSAKDAKSAIKMFPKEVEAHYLLYNIYALELLVMSEERRVYGSYFPKEHDERARKNMDAAWKKLKKIDPDLTKSGQYKKKYLNMNKHDLNEALNKIFYKDE